MKEQATIWKVRAIKPYPEAHSHLLIGRVLAEHGPCVSLLCRSFHFGRNVNGVKDVVAGPLGTRIIPWNRVEIINELPDSFDFQSAKLIKDGKGQILLSDGSCACPIATRHDGR